MTGHLAIDSLNISDVSSFYNKQYQRVSVRTEQSILDVECSSTVMPVALRTHF